MVPLLGWIRVGLALFAAQDAVASQAKPSRRRLGDNDPAGTCATGCTTNADGFVGGRGRGRGRGLGRGRGRGRRVVVPARRRGRVAGAGAGGRGGARGAAARRHALADIPRARGGDDRLGRAAHGGGATAEAGGVCAGCGRGGGGRWWWRWWRWRGHAGEGRRLPELVARAGRRAVGVADSRAEGRRPDAGQGSGAAVERGSGARLPKEALLNGSSAELGGGATGQRDYAASAAATRRHGAHGASARLVRSLVAHLMARPYRMCTLIRVEKLMSILIYRVQINLEMCAITAGMRPGGRCPQKRFY